MKIPRFRLDSQHAQLGVSLLANAGILGLWTWLFRPVFPYLSIIFTRQEFRTNQIVLLAVLALIAFQVRSGRFKFSLGNLPQLNLAGLGLALGGSAAFVAVERWLDVNSLSAHLS